MSDYVAPVDDMLFALEEVCGVHYDGLPDLLAEAGRFVSEVVAPTNRDGDRVGSKRNDDGSVTTPPGFKAAYRKYVDGGWPAAAFNPEYGGGGLPWSVATAIAEMLTSANMAFSLCPMLTQGSIHMLEAHGSDDQKNTYLPKLISGEWTGTMLLTEPQAGSDVGALTTRAIKQSDGTYRLFGQKIFITWGEHDFTDNIVHITLARTPDAPKGTKGISVFIVPKVLADGTRNDITCVGLEHKMGIHASPTCVMALGENDGAVGYLIGDEQQGMRNMFTMMNYARLAVGVEGLAVAERAYQQALAFAHERRQPVPIIEFPDVQRMLVTMRAYVEALRALCYLNADAIDRGAAGQELADFLTPISKGWSTDMGTEVASLGVQVHGGMGFIEETGAAQHYRDIRIAAIYEGTNGIQAIDLVGRKLPARGGAMVRELVGEMRAIAVAEDLRTAYDTALDAYADAVDYLLTADRTDALAGATPFLRMSGLVVGAWLLARSAAISDHKQAIARFFITQLLPQAAAQLPAIKAGAAQLTLD